MYLYIYFILYFINNIYYVYYIILLVFVSKMQVLLILKTKSQYWQTYYINWTIGPMQQIHVAQACPGMAKDWPNNGLVILFPNMCNLVWNTFSLKV